MPLKVERGKNENNSRLVHRFNRKIRNSGIVNEAKENQYFSESLSEKQKKEKALKDIELKEEYERKRKLGEL